MGGAQTAARSCSGRTVLSFYLFIQLRLSTPVDMITVSVELSGGLELLFEQEKKKNVSIPEG